MALERPPRRVSPLQATVVTIVVAVLVGLVWLWPNSAEVVDDQPPAQDLRTATVTDVTTLPPDESGLEQVRVTFDLDDAPTTDRTTTIDTLVDQLPPLQAGDGIVVIEAGEAGDLVIVDLQRSSPLWWLLALFVTMVVLVTRWQGVRSLLGLGLSLVVVVRFVVPGILTGQPPVLVALVGSMAIMVATLLLTHGPSTRTSIAIVGTTVALVATIGLAVVFIDWAGITGLASDDAQFARVLVDDLDVAGLVLAGLIVATLGVLDDVTVGQASTVWALHDTDPGLTTPRLFRSAMSVGRDHIASTVNTLVLAYAGASLTLLVVFSTSGRPLADIVVSEVVATEVVKTLVGSLGLVAAVPITTWLASLHVVRRSDEEVRTSRRDRGHDGHDGHR